MCTVIAKQTLRSTFALRDSTGRIVYSAAVTIQAGPDSSCVGHSEPTEIITAASAVQCESVLLEWTGGESPYYISVLPGGQVSAAPLEIFPTQTGTSYTWNVDLAAGTSLTLQIRDATGSISYSAPFTVQPSSDSSCVGTD